MNNDNRNNPMHGQQQPGKNPSMDQDRNKKDQAGKFGTDKQAGRFGSDKQSQGREVEGRGKESGFSADRDTKGSVQSPRGDRK